MATIGTLKSTIAALLGKKADGSVVAVSDCSINGVDLLLLALNNARRQAERARSFRYSEVNATLSVASNGGALSAATIPGGGTIKEIDSIQIPASGGDRFSIEFMTNDEWADRIERAIGRQPYDATKTLAQLGVTTRNPIAYQQGASIFLYPASMFTFPVSVTMNVTRFLPDYTADADHDFFVDFAPDYLQWAGLVEMNKLWQQFVGRQEGTVDEASIKEHAAAALSALLIWDNGIDDSTSTPKPKPAPPAPQPKPEGQ
jgi:hypothetical protein